MGERFGYGVSRSIDQSCFAVAPLSVAPAGTMLLGMFSDNVRRPAKVLRVFDAGVSIVQIGDSNTLCPDAVWTDGKDSKNLLDRNDSGILKVGSDTSDAPGIRVRVTDVVDNGFFAITPALSSVNLIEAMNGSPVLVEDAVAGMLLSVDEANNVGRVIRQDFLHATVAPFFNSSSLVAESQDSSADSLATDAMAVDPDFPETMLTNPVLTDRSHAPSESETTATDQDDSAPIMHSSVSAPDSHAQSSTDDASSLGKLDNTLYSNSRPQIVHKFFIGKQTWRNRPLIIGKRLFIGSSGRTWNEPDDLDGAYSFDIETGDQLWFVHTDNDFNDLAYVGGLVVGGTDSGKVLGIGARSGKTYWTRQLGGKVYARPAKLGDGVAIATSAGSLHILDIRDGLTVARSRLDAGVRSGLVAAHGELWVATESGVLYRYLGFGEVQIRRESRVYYPDELGNKLTGIAIDWYDRLGKGRGQRAKFYGAPLVLDNRVILGLVRTGQYDYPPVMSFFKDGRLDWIGTDPEGIVGSTFGDSRLTPAPWYGQLIFADPQSNSVYALSKDRGEVVWATDLGHRPGQHWASPVVANDFVYVARHDGFLHKLRAKDGKRVWSIFLGQESYAGRTYMEDEPLPVLESDFEWRASRSHPIFSTPAIENDNIVVGTNEGYVYVVKDPGE